MAKGTSASKARKEQMLKKYSGEGATTAALKQAERDRSADKDWQGSWWAKYLSSHENPEMMALRILSDDGLISDSALLESMMKLIPGTFSRFGTSMSEVIENAQRIYTGGIVIDEEMIHNGIIRRFAKKLVKLQPVLWIGINTPEPEEIPWYDGPAPSWTPPHDWPKGEPWKLTPDWAVVLFKVPGLQVSYKEASNNHDRLHKLIALHHRHYRRLLEWAARDEILVLTRKFRESGEGESTAGQDVGEMLAQIDSDDKFTGAGYGHHMKTPNLGLHESHRNSSPTIEASAAALAKVMMEEIVGKNWYGPPTLQTDGTYRRQLVIEELGLIGELEGMGEDTRRHVRLLAFLHIMDSLYYKSEEKVGRDGQIYRTYKRVSADMIANEWSGDNPIDHPRVINTFIDHRGEQQPMTVHVVTRHDELIILKGTSSQEQQRVWYDECEMCLVQGAEKLDHYQEAPGRPGLIHISRKVFDGDSRHFFGEDEDYLVMTREITNRTELMSHEGSLTKRKMAKAMDAFYTLMGLARHQLMTDEGFIEGPRTASGLFYSKLHPAESGRGLDYTRVDAEGIRHPITDAMGWWFDWKWEDHTSYGENTLVKERSFTQFEGTPGDIMKFGEYVHFYDDALGNRRAKAQRGVWMHPEHDGCVLDGKLNLSRVEPTYVVSELDDIPETPLIKESPKSEKDVFNETLTSLLIDIQLGE